MSLLDQTRLNIGFPIPTHFCHELLIGNFLLYPNKLNNLTIQQKLIACKGIYNKM